MSDSKEIEDLDSLSLNEWMPESSNEDTGDSQQNNFPENADVEERTHIRETPHGRAPHGAAHGRAHVSERNRAMIALLMCAAYLMSIPEERMVQEDPALGCSELGRILHLASCPLMPVDDFIALMVNAVDRHSNVEMASGMDSCLSVSNETFMDQEEKNASETSDFETNSGLDYCTSLTTTDSVEPTEGTITRCSEHPGTFDSDSSSSKSDDVPIPKKEDSFARHSDLMITSELDYYPIVPGENSVAPTEHSIPRYSEQQEIFDSDSCPSVSSGNSQAQKEKIAFSEWSDFETTSDFDYFSSLPGEDFIAPTENTIPWHSEQLETFDFYSCSSDEVSIPEKEDADLRITSELGYCPSVSGENSVAKENVAVTKYSESRAFDFNICSSTCGEYSLSPKEDAVTRCSEQIDFDFDYFSVPMENSIQLKEDTVLRYSNLGRVYNFDYCPFMRDEDSVTQNEATVTKCPKQLNAFNLDSLISVTVKDSLAQEEDAATKFSGLLGVPELRSRYFESLGDPAAQQEDEYAFSKGTDQGKACLDSSCSHPDEESFVQHEDAVSRFSGLLGVIELRSRYFESLGDPAAQQEDEYPFARGTDQGKACLDSSCSHLDDESFAQKEDRVISGNNEKGTMKLASSIKKHLNLFAPYNSPKTDSKKKVNLDVCQFCNPCRGARPKTRPRNVTPPAEVSHSEEKDSMDLDEFNADLYTPLLNE